MERTGQFRTLGTASPTDPAQAGFGSTYVHLIPPRDRYRLDLAQPDFEHDPAQDVVVEHLQSLFEVLVTERKRRGRWQRLKNRLAAGKQITDYKGLYIWGGVGRGKTYLMDLFYGCLPFGDKTRRHFHRFMHKVHYELKQLKDRENPLAEVADRIADKARVICFDEFHVSDIADAMILGNLFDALFKRGIVLVATSNMPPDQLYRDGLQRERFIPGIRLLENNTTVVHLDGDIDYRFRILEKAEIYHSPLDPQAEENLERCFESIAPEPGKYNHVMKIEGRPIQTRFHADGVVWCDFGEICGDGRGTADYIEIARRYQTVLISNIPALTEAIEDQARRFIALIDESYDHNVKLIASAAEPLESLYQGSRLTTEFERTRSRLQEMQTREYLSRQHVP